MRRCLLSPLHIIVNYFFLWTRYQVQLSFVHVSHRIIDGLVRIWHQTPIWNGRMWVTCALVPLCVWRNSEEKSTDSHWNACKVIKNIPFQFNVAPLTLPNRACVCVWVFDSPRLGLYWCSKDGRRFIALFAMVHFGVVPNGKHDLKYSAENELFKAEGMKTIYHFRWLFFALRFSYHDRWWIEKHSNRKIIIVIIMKNWPKWRRRREEEEEKTSPNKPLMWRATERITM